jgi:hypothetical protein
MYVWWGRSKKKRRGTWVVGKKRKEKRKKKLINNVMIKIKFKNQNYVPNTIFFTILNSNQD